MKGIVSTKAFYIVGAIIIGLMILITSQSIIKKILENEAYFETKLTQLGIRNNMLLASTLEGGRIMYETVDGSRYVVSIDNQGISVVQLDDAGNQRLDAVPIPILHYTPNAVPKEITADKFCIVKKEDSDCKELIEVCAAKDIGCCSPSRC